MIVTFFFFCVPVAPTWNQVEAILSDLRQDAENAERNASAVAASTTKTAVDKAKTRSAATRAARVFDELLRALGARGRGLDSGGRPYGLSLLQVVEDVAAQAHACGERSQGVLSVAWRYCFSSMCLSLGG